MSSPHTPRRAARDFALPPPPLRPKRCSHAKKSSNRRKIRHRSIDYASIPPFTLLKTRPILSRISADSSENTSPITLTNSMHNSSPLERYMTRADRAYMHPCVPKTPARATNEPPFRRREPTPCAFASTSPEITSPFVEQGASPLSSSSSPAHATLDVGSRSDMSLGLFLQSDGAFYHTVLQIYLTVL